MRPFPTEFAVSAGASAQLGPGGSCIHREPNATPSNRENNRATMPDGRIAPPGYPVAHSSLAESVFGPEALYISARKCAKGVGQKYGTQFYGLNIIEKTVVLANEIARGKYREGLSHLVHIPRPKKRTALAISFRDRVVQRSLNDVALYPQVTRGFIWSNFACQKGKGTDAARKFYRQMLHSAWLKWRTNKFKIIEFDIKGYYESMRHEETDRIFAKRCDPWAADTASRTLAHQYKGEVGYNPGSQMVQIAGIAYLDEIDHFIKENLRERFYLHYMDDGRIAVAPDADTDAILGVIAERLEKIGLRFHPDKTVVVTADNGGIFLGFKYRATESGKVLMFRDPACVKANRRTYRRLANKIKRREALASDLKTSYTCVRNFMAKGNSKRLLRRMDHFVNSLMEEINGTDNQGKSVA